MADPSRPPMNVTERIHALMEEIRQLSPEDYRLIEVPLMVALSTSATSGTDTFRALTTHHFVIKELRGHILIRDVTSETVAVSNYGNPSYRDRIAIKANNCRVTLQNTDRSQKVFESSNNLNLGSFMRVSGGAPIVVDPPHILPAGETLEATFTLVDTTSAVVGGTSKVEYGLILVGHYVRARAS